MLQAPGRGSEGKAALKSKSRTEVSLREACRMQCDISSNNKSIIIITIIIIIIVTITIIIIIIITITCNMSQYDSLNLAK